MKWSKEIPTEDGWYWIKTDWTVLIDYVSNGSILEWNGVEEMWEDVEFDIDLGYEFYGPLEEPK